MTDTANRLRLGINIDHVATIRNARGGRHPDPLRAAHLAADAGADGITAHLREDRRHISDDDIARLSKQIDLPLNLEMAATPEMLAIAVRHQPHAVCIVPEKRQEVTTEGGLDVVSMEEELAHYVKTLTASGSRVSLFIDPEVDQIMAAKRLGAPVVELHTGKYCDTSGPEREAELARIKASAAKALAEGLEVHAGHGLSFTSVAPIAAIDAVRELNIGHFLVGEAIMIGFDAAILKMRRLMDAARGGA
ncbi:MAG: pyridoxine 5'-phosphate synthase [Pseudomonadota bacterium]